MIPLQTIALIYAGMLLESPARREQFMNFINGAGAEVEKVVNGMVKKTSNSNKESESDNESESSEFR